MVDLLIRVVGVALPVLILLVWPRTFRAVRSWSGRSTRRGALIGCALGCYLIVLESICIAAAGTSYLTGTQTAIPHFGAGSLLVIGLFTVVISAHAAITGSWSGPNLPTALRILYLFLLLGGSIMASLFIVARLAI